MLRDSAGVADRLSGLPPTALTSVQRLLFPAPSRQRRDAPHQGARLRLLCGNDARIGATVRETITAMKAANKYTTPSPTKVRDTA